MLLVKALGAKRLSLRRGVSQRGPAIAGGDDRIGWLTLRLEHGDRALVPLVIRQQDERRGRASAEQQAGGDETSAAQSGTSMMNLVPRTPSKVLGVRTFIASR